MTTTIPRSLRTIGQLVGEKPGRARVFERLGIDYCCGGRKSLAEVCVKRGLDIAALSAELDAAGADSLGANEPDWTTAPLRQLADHIESTHHEFLRRELPRLAALIRKVTGVHGRTHPALGDLERTFAKFSCELLLHMGKEESVLFPAIRTMETETGPRGGASLDMPIRCMMHEHDDAGAALSQMRQLTEEFTPPPDACGSYRVMLAGLQDLEADMHAHVHKENNILFPRALALGGERKPASASESLGIPGACACSIRFS